MSRHIVLRVAVPAPIYSCFDYLPPKGIDLEALLPGVRLLVPFGKNERCGLLLEVVAESELEVGRLKRASKILDRQPLLGPEDLGLLLWAANYYHYPVGEVIAAALPVRLRKGKPASIRGRPGWRLTGHGAGQDPESLTRAPRQSRILRLLQQQPDGQLAQEDIYTGLEGECRSILRALEDKGWLESCLVEPETLQPGGVAASTAECELNPDQQSA